MARSFITSIKRNGAKPIATKGKPMDSMDAILESLEDITLDMEALKVFDVTEDIEVIDVTRELEALGDIDPLSGLDFGDPLKDMEDLGDLEAILACVRDIPPYEYLDSMEAILRSLDDM